MASSAQQKQFINEIGYIIQEEAKREATKWHLPLLHRPALSQDTIRAS